MGAIEMTMTTTDPIEAAIARLDDPATDTDMIAETMNRLEFAMEQARELYDRGKQAIERRIKQTGRPVEYGQWLWVLSEKKTTKCVDIPLTTSTLLSVLGGDFEQLCQLMAAQPFKYGACKQVLAPEVYGQLFKVEVKEGVERELRKIDKRFIEGKVA